LQLELLTEEEPGATREEVQAESQREPILTAPPRKRKPHPGRKPLPESLPRIEEVIACGANGTHCGGETRVIGYDLSEVLDREPAKWFVRVTKREKRSCGKCSAIQMPPLGPRIVEKGLASDRVSIETVVAKYCDHRVPRTCRQRCRCGAVEEMREGPSKPKIRIRLQTTASCCR
jgi:transposase